ncbi:Lrp/AsnC family transcriptional regulator [Leucobacter sp. OH2974_COT-288]|uniref:DNA-binding Lrp family transcriptional regulator n=1 Tax=Canibacter oris TaxID=1365628 RepID=A0A840DG53_9MICO|nr:DNA-binding Lrp family transcriptional regulator [Canibacter oris]RRD36434.1 Lrp/AsnC family transcriptional regulator [Leucobacter sp. OH2974_COT-288]
MSKANNLRSDICLDEVDQKIVLELQLSGRITNAELAERVGIAASTCIARVRSLIERRVITGFSARVNPETLGLGIQVLISVTIRNGKRQLITELAEQLRSAPEVTQLFFLGGEEDFIVHLLARDIAHVRDFVLENLSAHPAVSTTRTSIIFSHKQNPVTPPHDFA